MTSSHERLMEVALELAEKILAVEYGFVVEPGLDDYWFDLCDKAREIVNLRGRELREPPHVLGCICADCSDAELTSKND